MCAVPVTIGNLSWHDYDRVLQRLTDAQTRANPSGTIGRAIQNAPSPSREYRSEFAPAEFSRTEDPYRERTRYRWDDLTSTPTPIDPTRFPDPVPGVPPSQQGPGYEFIPYPPETSSMIGRHHVCDIKAAMPLLDDLTTAQWEQLAGKLSEILTAEDLGVSTLVTYHSDKVHIPRRPTLALTLYRRSQERHPQPAEYAQQAEMPYTMGVDMAETPPPVEPVPAEVYNAR